MYEKLLSMSKGEGAELCYPFDAAETLKKVDAL